MKDTVVPPSSFEEKLKNLLVPPGLYIRYRTAKEMRRGEKELHLLPYIVPRGKIALDIGANKGVWAYSLSKLCREVHAFEPNPKIYSILERGRAANVHTYSIALSNQTGEAEFRVPRTTGGYSNQGGSLSTVKVPDNFMAVPIETRRLDDMDLRDIGFMKLDVEGFEMAVLEGGTKAIARDRPVLLIEIEERHTGRPLADMITEVEARGYQTFVLSVGGLQLFSRVYDGAFVNPGDKHINNFIFFPTR